MNLNIKAIAFALLMTGGAMAISSCTEDAVYDIDVNAVPQAGDYADNVSISVDQSTNTATFSFEGDGVYPVWCIDGKTYTTQHKFTKFYRKAGEYSVDVKIGNANGISKGTITKTFTVDKTQMSGFGGFVYDSAYNLWTKSKRSISSFWYAPGWNQIADPTNSFDGDTFTLFFPEATTDQWQAQMHVGTDISLPQGEHYDGSIIFTADKDMKNITVKIHPDGDDDDSHSFFMQQKINLTADEPQAFFFSDLEAAVDMNSLVYTFDFGGNPEGVNVIIENVVLKKHSDDDGTEVPVITVPEPNWADVNSADNLWSTMNFTNSFYYAPGWSPIADPVLTFNGRDFTVDLPEATFEQWQAQVATNTDIAIPDASVGYDFKITLKSNVDHGGVTVKLTQTDEGETKHDKNYFFGESVALKAETPYTFWVSNVKLAEGAAHALSLVLDFGGNPANTSVEVSNIILQVHHD